MTYQIDNLEVRPMKHCRPIFRNNSRSFRWGVLGMIPVLAGLAAGQAFAQTTFGTFVGTVRDPSGSVVAGSIVSATNNGTSAKRSTLTDKDGGYVLVNIEAGNYAIEIQASGFQPFRIKSVDLTARETVRTD